MGFVYKELKYRFLGTFNQFIIWLSFLGPCPLWSRAHSETVYYYLLASSEKICVEKCAWFHLFCVKIAYIFGFYMIWGWFFTIWSLILLFSSLSTGLLKSSGPPKNGHFETFSPIKAKVKISKNDHFLRVQRISTGRYSVKENVKLDFR